MFKLVITNLEIYQVVALIIQKRASERVFVILPGDILRVISAKTVVENRASGQCLHQQRQPYVDGDTLCRPKLETEFDAQFLRILKKWKKFLWNLK